MNHTENLDKKTNAVNMAYVPPPETGYVGSAVCAECHDEIARSYQSHPMAISFQPIENNIQHVFTNPEKNRVIGEKRVYEVVSRDGKMLHHEKMFDASGEPIYDQAVEVKYIVGSGQHAKAYLHQRGDMLFMSPLNWYSRTRQWDLAPGYKADDPRRFDRRVTDDCLHCHTGRVAVKGRSLNKYSNPAFHEMSIGCENCHGPGEQHVLFQNSESPADVLTDPIVNPKHLDHDRRESVCYQCHLGGVVRTLRFGRSEFDFRPGQRIEDIWLVLEADSGIGEDGRTKSVSHVQQMQMSRCYTESAGRFGCVSCHDPHRVPSLSERPDYYRRKCFECHDNSSCSLSHELRMEEENSCISCHMPVRDSSNMAHVVQTDHRVIRSLKIVQRSGFDQDPDQLQIHDRENSQLDDQEKNRALGLGSWLFLTKKGRHPPTALARTLLCVLEKSPNDGAVLTVLGSLASQNGLTTQARDYYERARNIPDAREAALGGLLNIYYLSSEWNKALECANALIEIDSGNARFHAIKADTLSNLGKTAEGIESAKRALALNPTLTSVRQWLVKTLHSAGRDKERNAQEQILKRMRNARAPD